MEGDSVVGNGVDKEEEDNDRFEMELELDGLLVDGGVGWEERDGFKSIEEERDGRRFGFEGASSVGWSS